MHYLILSSHITPDKGMNKKTDFDIFWLEVSNEVNFTLNEKLPFWRTDFDNKFLIEDDTYYFMVSTLVRNHRPLLYMCLTFYFPNSRVIKQEQF